jgi:hypothetical protein
MAWLPDFDEMRRRGLAVLEDGLPPLPEELKNSDMIPVSCWTTDLCGVVHFVFFLGHAEGVSVPTDVTLQYGREREGWYPIKNGLFWSSHRAGTVTDLDFRRSREAGVTGEVRDGRRQVNRSAPPGKR